MSTHSRTRSHRAEFALALIVLIIFAVGHFGHQNATENLPQGLAIPADAESMALYCTGFTGGGGATPAVVTFVDASNTAHDVTATLVSSTGASRVVTLQVPAHGVSQLTPSEFPGNGYYSVSALVHGGGVSASSSFTRAATSVIPCVGQGDVTWYSSGLSTHVGADAFLTMFNPTAGEDVVSVTALSPTGFFAPSGLQGLVLAAHSTTTVDLGASVVNQTDIMATVHAQRGSVVVAALQMDASSKTSASATGGVIAPSRFAVFPSTTTFDGVRSVLAIANPTSAPAVVSVSVVIRPYATQRLSITVNALSVGDLVVSPSSGVPAAGAAVLSVTSTMPIVTTLVTQLDNKKNQWLLAPALPGADQAIVDPTGQGFASASLVNTGDQPASVVLSAHNFTGSHSVTLIVPGHDSRVLNSDVVSAWKAGAVSLTSDQPLYVSAAVAGPYLEGAVENGLGVR